MTNEVVICSAVRTAVGTFQGSLTPLSAAQLGTVVIKEALARAGVEAGQLDEVIMGNVLQAGLGQNSARQASIHAGVPQEVPAMTVNKVCGSGLKTIMLAAQAIRAGDGDAYVAGGMESMTNAPYLLPSARSGYRMGHGQLVDDMVKDGLWCAFVDQHMGITAENVAERYHVTREDQDAFAASSQAKALAAIEAGRFKQEIFPVAVPQRKGDPTIFDVDEGPRVSTPEILARLRPAFKQDGTVTAGNASGINDAAAAVTVLSAAKAADLSVSPLARVLTYASVGLDPAVMGMGPVYAIRKVLDKAKLTIDDIDLFEINEAFASQSVAVMRELHLPEEKVNVNGGAIAIGHPIGASGTRIFVTLLHELRRRGGRYGIASLCIGGGQGVGLLVERI